MYGSYCSGSKAGNSGGGPMSARTCHYGQTSSKVSVRVCAREEGRGREKEFEVGWRERGTGEGRERLGRVRVEGEKSK